MADQQVTWEVEVKRHHEAMTKMRQQKATVESFGDAARKAGKGFKDFSGNVRGASQMVGDLAQRVKFLFSVGVVSAFGVGAKGAIVFESSMDRVLAITGANETQFAQLNQTALELGASTRFS